MPGPMTLGSDATGSTFDSAVAYVRNKIAEFRLLGTVELPALWFQANKIYNAASERGDLTLAGKAADQRNRIKAAQDEWERNNDKLESVLTPLRSAGITGLGALPIAAWVVLATIGIAAAMAAAFVFRDQARTEMYSLCIEAVQRGTIPASECGNLAPKDGGFLAGVGTTVVLGGLAYWFLFRKRS